jgi:hypothetical protein
MKKEKSKISFEQWGQTFTIEKSNSYMTIGEFHQICRQLALGAGYAESIVNEYFDQL